MLSPADILIIGGFALIIFGPDQLPKVARNAGRIVRDVQSTSQAFIREMEFAADDPPPHRSGASAPEPAPYQAYDHGSTAEPGAAFAKPDAASPAARLPGTAAVEPAIRTTSAVEPPAG